MKILKAEFVKSATRPRQFPPDDLPEVAFAGRSNVGKSSLINSLVGRSKLVKTSKTPGRTQLINFFNINDALYFVDLPGYGFARVPQSVRDAWRPMIEGYFANRPNLRAVCCLVDIRRGVQEDDQQLIEALAHFGLQPILVLTKADKYGRNAGLQRRREIAAQIGANPEDFVMFSSLKHTGHEAMWKRITQLTGVS